MIRGEFIRADGKVIPNSLTEFGAQLILQLAFQNSATDLWLGLCNTVPSGGLQIETASEPTIGVGGYRRIQLAPTIVEWPIVGFINSEAYVESMFVTFSATGDGFDKPIRRLMLVASPDAATGNVFSVSSALPSLLTILPTTPEVERTFKYRLYLR